MCVFIGDRRLGASSFRAGQRPIIEGFASRSLFGSFHREKPPHIMPIYAYKCESCGHTKDVLQKMSDAPLTDCPQCGAATFKKQLTAAGFQLKGSGWYVTDFRDGPKGGATAGESGSSESAAKSGDGAASASAAPAPAATSSASASPAPSSPSPSPAPAAGSASPAPPPSKSKT